MCISARCTPSTSAARYAAGLPSRNAIRVNGMVLLLSMTLNKRKRHVRLGAANYNEQSFPNISSIYT
ncbi:hypothetical protein C6T65_32630 [Burkholderia vietnamiensis]|uniref:Uncharacterized protein n=1 Tax=Burkholderia vietnamiensis TaxID=60552 RepID=A0AA44XU09_BURVI|nr:hypothetical protein C6T65_32630 [Burkholderia vietnamiensis]